MLANVAGDVIPLGTRLRTRREELGLTQAQAARELDVARTAYRLWELEAARPAPDRWRSIAKWLGMSVTAMLLAGELIDEAEAREANQAAVGAGLGGERWDAQSDGSEGDFFSQERAMISDQARMGAISGAQAASLRGVLDRIQEITATDGGAAWHPGEYRKRLPCTPLAPGIARAALAATAVGIPVEFYDAAALLVSELVTNCVLHSGSRGIDVAIALGVDTLRVEVSDDSTQALRPVTPDDDGGWGLAFVSELAHRWGVERRRDGKTVWVELDLLSPVD
jgi:transcriptional regulator with XRE-family HTH domain/anti-sigma regulatory factor (Ser/Thr protein kinase)